tara:strand:- start:250 stop:708 length:459 start_codon:yes stop_codon:yes gene_type:complete
MILEYAKVREGVRAPERANPSDAGLDVFHNPKKTSTIILNPGENALFPIGVRFGVPHGYMLQVMNRSSMAAKRNLVVGAHCIDSGYDGEVFIDLHNIGKERQQVHPGDKIAQVVLVPVIPFRTLESKGGDLYDKSPITISDRGEGALGSTDQ